MKFRIDKGTGYLYCYAPKHPCANKAGKVLEHVFVMYKHIGRMLKPDECVHHIDRDKTNNSIENLMLLTISQHAQLHAIEDKGYSPCIRKCDKCEKEFVCSVNSSRKFCSQACCVETRKMFEVSAEDLECLVWSMPTVEVAKIFGVSDKAIEKRCKKFKISKPPRGYWAKIKSNKMTSKISED